LEKYQTGEPLKTILEKLGLPDLIQKIRRDPSTLIHNPGYILLLPLSCLQSIRYRITKSKTRVFLTETRLDQLAYSDREIVTDERIVVFQHIDNFREFAKKRINEDDSIDNSYLEIVAARFAKGDFAIVLQSKEGVVVSYLFISTGMAFFSPVGMTIQLPRHTYAVYDVYTFSSCMQKGFYSFLFKKTAFMMRHRDYHTVWLWLMAHNTVSIVVHYKLGLRMITRILTETVGYGRIVRNAHPVNMSLLELDKIRCC
jgi:hypothetical protein